MTMTHNHMTEENPALYFAILADFIRSAHRELEKAENQEPGADLQTGHLFEARLKLQAAIDVINRVVPPSP